MAGNITKLSLKDLKAKIAAYENANQKLYDDYLAIHNYMGNLKKHWTGERMNIVLNEFNKAHTTVFKGVQYFTDDVYNVLQEIYQQYQKLEKGKPGNVSKNRGMGTMGKLSLTTTETITFEKTKVESIAKNIQAKIKSLNTDLKNIVDDLDSMKAYSDSLNKMANNYKATAEKLNTQMKNLSNSFSTQLEQAVRDVTTTENYNEADANRLKQ